MLGRHWNWIAGYLVSSKQFPMCIVLFWLLKGLNLWFWLLGMESSFVALLPVHKSRVKVFSWKWLVSWSDFVNFPTSPWKPYGSQFQSQLHVFWALQAGGKISTWVNLLFWIFHVYRLTSKTVWGWSILSFVHPHCIVPNFTDAQIL